MVQQLSIAGATVEAVTVHLGGYVSKGNKITMNCFDDVNQVTLMA